MNTRDIPPAELDRWRDSILLMEECDNAAGITTPAVEAARAAYDAAADGRP